MRRSFRMTFWVSVAGLAAAFGAGAVACAYLLALGARRTVGASVPGTKARVRMQRETETDASIVRGLRAWRRRSPRLALALGTALVVLVSIGTGSAWAYIAHGSGSGTGNVTAKTLTVTATTGSITGTLYPGGTANLSVTISNPSSSVSLTVTGAVITGTVTVASAGIGSCTTPGVVLQTPTSITPSTLAAGAGSTAVVFANAVTMTNSSSTGCQGATFTVPIAVTTKVG